MTTPLTELASFPATSRSASVATCPDSVTTPFAGLTFTRGGSARSTSEPAARAAAELAAGRLSNPGAQAPEGAVDDPEAFLRKLDTELRWQ